MGLGALFLCALFTWSVLVCWFDANSLTIPNWLTLPAIAVTWGYCGLVAVGVIHYGGLFNIGAAVWGGAGWWLFIVAGGLLFRTHAAGAGDAKLAASLGVVVGAAGGLLAVLVAIGLAGFFGTLTGLLRKKRTNIPQGPAMICSMWIVTVCAAGL